MEPGEVNAVVEDIMQKALIGYITKRDKDSNTFMRLNILYKVTATSKGTTIFQPTSEPPMPGKKDVMLTCVYYILNIKNGYFYFTETKDEDAHVCPKYGKCGDMMSTGVEYVSSRVGNKCAFNTPTMEQKEALHMAAVIVHDAESLVSDAAKSEAEGDPTIDQQPDGFVMTTGMSYLYKGWMRYNRTENLIPIDGSILFQPYQLDVVYPCAEQNAVEPDLLHFERKVPMRCLEEAKSMTNYQDVAAFEHKRADEICWNKRLSTFCDDIENMDDMLVIKAKTLAGVHKKRKHIRPLNTQFCCC